MVGAGGSRGLHGVLGQVAGSRAGLEKAVGFVAGVEEGEFER